MTYPRLFTLTTIMALLAMFVFVGCSADETERKSSLVDEIVDSVSGALADNIVEATFTSETATEESSEGPPFTDGEVTGITDLAIVASTVYAVHDGGLVTYNLNSKDVQRIETTDRLNAVTYHEGKVYVGGDNLYTVVGDQLELVEADFIGDITALFSFQYRLMIGTEAGLYESSIFGDHILLDDVSVTGMAADREGLWVGTDGQGLYRWDGDEFKKRYLMRDTAIFDRINSLAGKNGHIYVGTDDAFYEFDGGKWRTVTTDDGLPSNKIVAIDASTWVVYIGTDAGVVSYHKNEFKPVNKLDNMRVTAMRSRAHRLFVGTDCDGLLMKSGPMLKTVVDPVDEKVEGELATSIQ